jgi:hypothetical protein
VQNIKKSKAIRVTKALIKQGLEWHGFSLTDKESKLKLFTDAVKLLVEEVSLRAAPKDAPFDSVRDLLGR